MLRLAPPRKLVPSGEVPNISMSLMVNMPSLHSLKVRLKSRLRPLLLLLICCWWWTSAICMRVLDHMQSLLMVSGSRTDMSIAGKFRSDKKSQLLSSSLVWKISSLMRRSSVTCLRKMSVGSSLTKDSSSSITGASAMPKSFAKSSRSAKVSSMMASMSKSISLVVVPTQEVARSNLSQMSSEGRNAIVGFFWITTGCNNKCW